MTETGFGGEWVTAAIAGKREPDRRQIQRALCDEHAHREDQIRHRSERDSDPPDAQCLDAPPAAPQQPEESCPRGQAHEPNQESRVGEARHGGALVRGIVGAEVERKVLWENASRMFPS